MLKYFRTCRDNITKSRITAILELLKQVIVGVPRAAGTGTAAGSGGVANATGRSREVRRFGRLASMLAVSPAKLDRAGTGRGPRPRGSVAQRRGCRKAQANAATASAAAERWSSADALPRRAAR